MELEISKVLVSGLVGVGGVMLGAWLNQRGARRLAERTLEGQRIVARDAALREWRASWIRPVLDVVNQRTALYLELALALYHREQEEVDSLRRELRRKLNPFHKTPVGPTGVLRLDAAVAAYVDADLDCERVMASLGGQQAAPSGRTQVDLALAKLEQTRGALHQAAEEYIHTLPRVDGSGAATAALSPLTPQEDLPAPPYAAGDVGTEGLA